ncbi:hypothetical protein SBA4_1020010 [Candidatus Sulfopaludibacter sp. SbA4]|nr:hypothetical protein SBA4_1020010 [Candidatus Sulfopaludibacter sp. SbA4]
MKLLFRQCHLWQDNAMYRTQPARGLYPQGVDKPGEIFVRP